MTTLIERACSHVFFSSAECLDTPHLIIALMELPESWAAFLLNSALGENAADFKSCILSAYDVEQFEGQGTEGEEQNASEP